MLTILKKMYPIFLLTLGVTLISYVYSEHTAAATFGDFEYTVSGNEATIIDYTGQNTSVTIPNVIGASNEYTVTSIGSGAFAQKFLTNVTIPNTVVNIGAGAFTRNYLTQLTLPDSVQTIGQNVFSVNEIAEVTLSQSLKDIPNYAFYNNKLKKINIPTSVSNIKISAFENNNITDITVSNPATQFDYSAFAAQTTSGTLIVPSNHVLPIADYLHFQDASGQLTLNNATIEGLADGVSYDASKGALVFTAEPVTSPLTLFTGTNRLDSYYDISEYGFSGQTIVSFKYTKPVVVTYVDEKGNELTDSIRLDGSIGDTYTSKAQTIDGYTLKEVNGNVSGTFTTDIQNVTYVYEKDPIKNGQVIVNYQDESGNKIAESITLTGEVGSHYQTENKTIDGYTLKKIVGKEAGEIAAKPTTVTYIYGKTDTYTDNNKTNNKTSGNNMNQSAVGPTTAPTSAQGKSINTSEILPLTGEVPDSGIPAVGGLLTLLSVWILFRKP